MNYGFLIDNRRCIGCHACSTACKSENRVPLGVYRTWVKVVEKGRFPDARRSFQVTRCNHCANPPCVRICPVTAMYQRQDGIVEFDPEVCIGCKACLQACPYDAIHIDPDTGTAAKCHYCSHRTDLGLEPACVVVCPTQAIVAGDLDDPESRISRLVAREPVSVRKPEQGTAPKLFYIEGDDVALTPTAARAPGSFAFADLVSTQDVAFEPELWSDGPGRGSNGSGGRTAASGVALRKVGDQGLGAGGGPLVLAEARQAEHMVQTAYNAQHRVPWHWPVPAYLVTKAIGTGLFMLLAITFGLGIGTFDRTVAMSGAFVSLVFIGLTTALLVYDLEKPGRFFSILLRPQWKSWLTRGAFILVGFTLVAGAWFLFEAFATPGRFASGPVETLRRGFLLFGFVLALLAAIYTAFLFGQAEGRDLWQSALAPFHLLNQALMAGAVLILAAASLIITGLLPGLLQPIAQSGLVTVALLVFTVTVFLDLFLLLFGETGTAHASEVAARAAHAIRYGKYSGRFWLGAVVLGHAVPIALMVFYVLFGQRLAAAPWMLPVLWCGAAAATLAGLYIYEYVFVTAPQEVPNA